MKIDENAFKMNFILRFSDPSVESVYLTEAYGSFIRWMFLAIINFLFGIIVTFANVYSGKVTVAILWAIFSSTGLILFFILLFTRKWITPYILYILIPLFIVLFSSLTIAHLIPATAQTHPATFAIVVFALISVLRPPLYTALIYLLIAFICYAVWFPVFPVSEWGPRGLLARFIEVLAVAIASSVSLYNAEKSLRTAFATRIRIAAEKETLEANDRRTAALLRNMLPSVFVEALRIHRVPLSRLAKRYPCISVLQSDIVSFTTFSTTRPARTVVRMLNVMFRHFDHAAARLGLEKIKTIGDAYICVGSVPYDDPLHPHRTVVMGLQMIASLPAINQCVHEYDTKDREEGLTDQHAVSNIAIRVGVGSGPCTAGILGIEKVSYDVIGLALARAERMEQTGVSCRVQCDALTVRLLADDFIFDENTDEHQNVRWFAVRPRSHVFQQLNPPNTRRFKRNATHRLLKQLQPLGFANVPHQHFNPTHSGPPSAGSLEPVDEVVGEFLLRHSDFAAPIELSESFHSSAEHQPLLQELDPNASMDSDTSHSPLPRRFAGGFRSIIAFALLASLKRKSRNKLVPTDTGGSHAVMDVSEPNTSVPPRAPPNLPPINTQPSLSPPPSPPNTDSPESSSPNPSPSPLIDLESPPSSIATISLDESFRELLPPPSTSPTKTQEGQPSAPTTQPQLSATGSLFTPTDDTAPDIKALAASTHVVVPNLLRFSDPRLEEGYLRHTTAMAGTHYTTATVIGLICWILTAPYFSLLSFSIPTALYVVGWTLLGVHVAVMLGLVLASVLMYWRCHNSPHHDHQHPDVPKAPVSLTEYHLHLPPQIVIAWATASLAATCVVMASYYYSNTEPQTSVTILFAFICLNAYAYAWPQWTFATRLVFSLFLLLLALGKIFINHKGPVVEDTYAIGVATLLGILSAYHQEAADRAAFLSQTLIEARRTETERSWALGQRLLNTILPPSIVARVAAGQPPSTIVDDVPSASVLFIYFTGSHAAEAEGEDTQDTTETGIQAHTLHATEEEPQHTHTSDAQPSHISVWNRGVVPRCLENDPGYRTIRKENVRLTVLDRLVRRHGVEKIKTTPYLVVSGCPDPVEDHAVRLLRFAVDAMDAVQDRRNIRIGIHTGRLSAGILGTHKFMSGTNTHPTPATMCLVTQSTPRHASHPRPRLA